MEDSFVEFVRDESHMVEDKVRRIMYDVRCGKYSKVIFLVGAGISVAAGYPTIDRSIESVFSSDSNPYGWYRDLRSFCIDAEPTPFHTFMHETAWKIYTQNIDGLDANSDPRVEYVHGKLSDGGTCVDCGNILPWPTYSEQLLAMYVHCPNCSGHIRPNIVMYGEQTHIDFEATKTNLQCADIVICAGTSLSVYPFAGLLDHVNCPVIIIDTNITANHVRYSTPGRILYSGDANLL